MTVDSIPTVRMDDRLGFRYVEKATVYVKDNTIFLVRKSGVRDHICPSETTCLLLGSGTSITRDAVKLFSEQNTTILWCGKRGLSMYSVGLNANSSMSNAKIQIERTMSHRISLWKKLLFARNISYRDTSNVKELLLIEASFMKKQYETLAKSFGLVWNGRIPQTSKMDPDDTLNYAITICNMALYGVAVACICGMGYLPQFGIIHGSGATPLAYDIADVVKTYTSIPIAMEYVSSHHSVDINELLATFSLRLTDVNITKVFTGVLLDLFQKRL